MHLKELLQPNLSYMKRTALALLFPMLLTSCGRPSKDIDEKRKEPQISEMVTLRSNMESSREVLVSNDPKSWMKANEVSYVPNGTPAKILAIHDETIEVGDMKLRVLRYKVITNTSPKVEGWVHSFDAGYSTEK